MFILKGNVYSQLIISKKFDFTIKTNYDSTKTIEINQFLNAKLNRIVLVRIKPHCENKFYLNFLNTKADLIKYKRCDYKTIIRGDTIKPDMIEKYTELHDRDYLMVLKSLFIPDSVMSSGVCYEPRHGILFFGAENDFIGFVEICFKCLNYSNLLIPGIQISKEDYNQLKGLYEKYEITLD